ncbi:hypothetical protein [Arthrobacter mobilis]|uniref:Uncharacterized protein n=1 Tax=Arthrobacter mobilis TaxID=2724944 RepID=A0A7X6K6L0_9MICC|nr:hypothetical protein [Arthrobacter mobilis]NKX56004.1 hypothetical protein [Arthrobacter mobilis]
MIINAFTHIRAGEGPAELRARQPELFRDLATARDSIPKDTVVAEVTLTVPDDHEFCVRHSYTPEDGDHYRLSTFENARSVAFGSGARFGLIHALTPATPRHGGMAVHLAEFITEVKAA